MSGRSLNSCEHNQPPYRRQSFCSEFFGPTQFKQEVSNDPEIVIGTRFQHPKRRSVRIALMERWVGNHRFKHPLWTMPEAWPVDLSTADPPCSSAPLTPCPVQTLASLKVSNGPAARRRPLTNLASQERSFGPRGHQETEGFPGFRKGSPGRFFPRVALESQDNGRLPPGHSCVGQSSGVSTAWSTSTWKGFALTNRFCLFAVLAFLLS